MRARVAASIRAKFITGSYILQSNRAAYNQHTVSDLCPLCGPTSGQPETLEHFLLVCEALEEKRIPHMKKIVNLLERLGIPVPVDKYDLCRLILNTGTPPESDPQMYKCDCGCELYNIACEHTVALVKRLRDNVNYLCLDLHNRRNSELAENQQGSKRSRRPKKSSSCNPKQSTGLLKKSEP